MQWCAMASMRMQGYVNHSDSLLEGVNYGQGRASRHYGKQGYEIQSNLI